MDRELKILLLEDSMEDVNLIERELRKAGIKSVFTITDTKEEFETALQGPPPDVILSDHSMPMFNSFEALAMVRAYKERHNRIIPFILVTGTVSEEFAAQCIQAGANDYILKHRLSRLPEAVRNAIKKGNAENERTAYVENILASERSRSEAEQLTHFGYLKLFVESQQMIWSDGIYALLDRNPGEVLPNLELFLESVHPDDRVRIGQELSNTMSLGVNRELGFRIITQRGTVKRVFSRIIVHDVAGSNSFLIGFVLELTERQLSDSLFDRTDGVNTQNKAHHPQDLKN